MDPPSCSYVFLSFFLTPLLSSFPNGVKEGGLFLKLKDLDEEKKKKKKVKYSYNSDKK